MLVPVDMAASLLCLQEMHPSVADFTSIADNCFTVRTPRPLRRSAHRLPTRWRRAPRRCHAHLPAHM